MREISFAELLLQKKELLFYRAENKKRLPKRRKRDPIEREILFQLDKTRWEKWLKSGKIKFVSDRHWKIKL